MKYFLIFVNDVTKVFENGAKGLKNVDISIKKGEFVFIVGTSGSGKTTLVRLLLKEIEPSDGQLFVNGVDLSKLKRRDMPGFRRMMGVVFQEFRLLPNKTVYDNVAFAMQIVGSSAREIRRNVPLVLTMVGLQKKARAYPNQLSGGEQQRTALARAIINKPPLLIADEPTGNLDPSTSWEIMTLLEDINNNGTTVVITSHDKEVVDAMKKRVISLKNGSVISDVEKGGYNNDI